MSRARRWNEMNWAVRSSISCELPRVASLLSPRLDSPSLFAPPRLFLNGLMPVTSFMSSESAVSSEQGAPPPPLLPERL
jgi:hypothetical protein